MGKRNKVERKKTTITKGQEGYWERNTDAAHSAAAKETAVFETAEDFAAAAEAYFQEADGMGKLYGEAGLCLGLTRFNKKGRNVSVSTLRRWYDEGLKSCPGLQEAVQMAYLRIQAQVETDPAYMEKGGMTTKAIFLLKQKRLGGYQDKQEAKADVNLNINFGKNMDESDFE